MKILRGPGGCLELLFMGVKRRRSLVAMAGSMDSLHFDQCCVYSVPSTCDFNHPHAQLYIDIR